MRRRARGPMWVAAGVALTALGIGAAPAEASTKVDSFAGSCSLQGNTTFSPPATNAQQALVTTYRASGTCSGVLNGRKVTDAPIKVSQSAHADASCLHASTTAPGHGTIAFRDGTTIRYTFTFTALLTEVDFKLRGARTGGGSGHGTFLTQRTPPDVPAQCAGEGISSAPMDVALSTDTPLVSGRGKPRHTDRDDDRGVHGVATFSGSCDVSGVVRFNPGLNNTPRRVRQSVRLPGTCSGTLVDGGGWTHKLSDSPMTYSETAVADGASCASGTPTGSGTHTSEIVGSSAAAPNGVIPSVSQIARNTV